ncbi:MAG TPA: phenylacetate--CoA ligase family protein [Thermoanaerobaculia bacterium]|jgi:phenylacetate-CoA ligase|nr:phenylacetate--CoA ligase family protein [Thermoanaerobaculia bacterium]
MDSNDSSLYTALLERAVIPFGDRLVGQGMMRRLQFLRQAQWWDPERIAAERERLLRELLAVAYREVPFYRDLWGGLGDLSELPPATKAGLRDGYPQGTTRDTGQRFYESCSSGSTGANFCVREDPETTGWHRASFLLALEWSGWRIGEPHLQTGMTLKRGWIKGTKDRLLRCAYVSAFDLSDEALDRALEILDRGRIEHLRGYPGSLYYLARRALERGWNRPLRGIVTWGDTLYAHYRETIERAFGARVLDTYGIGEGMQVAAQCEQHGLYHVHSLDVIVECVDDDLRLVLPGQTGHLLLTRLHPGPMPLIRYRVGDLGVMSGHPCPCGRGFATMESIQGRDTDVVVTPSGNRLIVHFFTGILNHFPEVESFQVVQETPGEILVRVVPTAGFSGDTPPRIVAALRAKGADLDIEVEPVAEIPVAPSGKRRFVLSRIGPSVRN